ncbi:MAG: flagellar basal body P-ring protein FlgI [Candidatus Omnitrophica bacterium]|nr:flagellar basal body P-ring protein FlgI [Candidatus Omnitrophota bacterium]
MKKIVFCVLIGVVCAVSQNAADAATRLKDIAHIQGVRENQLYGYGLVVGLNGTGDRQSSFPTLQSVGNMLRRLGMHVSPAEVSNKLRTRNIAAVMVTATLPAMARPGAQIDVTVSSIGDANSLEGGVLLQTPLQGADGNVYAVAQGPVSTGISTAGNTRGAPVTVARVPEGALVERAVPSTVVNQNKLSIVLRNPDFTTAARIIREINAQFSQPVASSQDGGMVEVRIPPEYKNNLVGFISFLETLSVEPDFRAKVIVNERTGTIVAGKDVKISTVAVSHGDISVQVNVQKDVTESTGGSRYGEAGRTSTLSSSKTIAGRGMAEMELVEESVSIHDLVKALNALGVAPEDLIAILQAIKNAGALHAALEFI